MHPSRCDVMFALAARATASSAERYLDSIEPWRVGQGYDVPAEFVVVAAARVQ